MSETYDPGEFERLYSDGFKIELIYDGGISSSEILTLPMLIKQLESLDDGCSFRLKSIEEAPGGAKLSLSAEDTGTNIQRDVKDIIRKEAIRIQSNLRSLIRKEQLQIKMEGKLEILRELVHESMTKPTNGPNWQFEGKNNNIAITYAQDKSYVNVEQNSSQVDWEVIRGLIEDLNDNVLTDKKLQKTLSSDELSKLHKEASSAKVQINKEKPNITIVRTSLASIGRILEGATASILAHEWLNRLLPYLLKLI